MNRFLERIEKIKHIDTYFWIFITLMFIVALKLGKNHYEKEKQDQHDILVLQSKIYQETALMYADSAMNAPNERYDTTWAKKSVLYQDVANRLLDSAKLILNQ